MENADSNEPERKQPHLTSVSSAMARNSTPSSPNNKSEKCPSRISKLESQVFRLEEELKKVHDEFKAIQKQNAIDPIAVAPAMNEIQRLKVQHEIVTDFEAATTKHVESTNAELQSLKENRAESVSRVQALTALVLKGIEFNQKLRPGLENLAIQSKALRETCFSQEKQICQLQHQLLVSNQKLKELEDGRGRSPERSLEDEEDLQEGH